MLVCVLFCKIAVPSHPFCGFLSASFLLIPACVTPPDYTDRLNTTIRSSRRSEYSRVRAEAHFSDYSRSAPGPAQAQHGATLLYEPSLVWHKEVATDNE